MPLEGPALRAAAEPERQARGMAAWRRRAVEALPELRSEPGLEDYGVYQLFIDLVPRVERAHADGDEGFLSRAYGFANRCASQKARDLWNAVGAAFFEHVFDRWHQRHLVAPWISPEVARGHWGLPGEAAQFRADGRTP
jgi:hypothetical protein